MFNWICTLIARKRVIKYRDKFIPQVYRWTSNDDHIWPKWEAVRKDCADTYSSWSRQTEYCAYNTLIEASARLYQYLDERKEEKMRDKKQIIALRPKAWVALQTPIKKID